MLQIPSNCNSLLVINNLSDMDFCFFLLFVNDFSLIVMAFCVTVVASNSL